MIVVVEWNGGWWVVRELDDGTRIPLAGPFTTKEGADAYR